MKALRATLMIALSGLASLAMAGDIRPFSQKDFDAMTAAGKSVVLDVSATWCPTCKAQAPIIDSFMKQPAFKDVTIMTIDFDDNKPTLNKFHVVTQSTLIAFHGTHEVGRSAGDTSQSGIGGLLQKSLN